MLGSTAYASIIVDIADSPLHQQEKAPDFKLPEQLPKFPSKAEDVTLEDIELFERTKGWRLVLIDKSGKRLKPIQWFKEQKKKKPERKKHLKNKVTHGVWWQQWNCKKRQIFNLGIK